MTSSYAATGEANRETRAPPGLTDPKSNHAGCDGDEPFALVQVSRPLVVLIGLEEHGYDSFSTDVGECFSEEGVTDAFAL